MSTPKAGSDPFDIALGARIRAWRAQLGMSQTELGRALDVSHQQMQKYESSANRLSGAALVRACSVLRVSAEHLLAGPDDAEADCTREDASTAAALASLRRIKAAPMRAQAARLIETLAECSEMQQAQAALATDCDLLGAMPFAIYTINAEGALTYFNEAAVAFAGRRPKALVDKWCVTWRLFRTDGVFLPHEECPMAVALKENRAIRGVHAIAERPDGVRRRFTPFPTPLHNASGALIGGINLLLEAAND